MEVHILVRRQATTIFTDANENSTVLELKNVIKDIMKVAPENQKLLKDDIELEDAKKLVECGLNANAAKTFTPATIVLCLRQEDGEFEAPKVTPYSTPPELPDVMRTTPDETAVATEKTAS